MILFTGESTLKEPGQAAGPAFPWISRFADRIIEAFAPRTALARANARAALRIMADYEAAKPSKLRKFRLDYKSGNGLTQQAAAPLRSNARWLEQNHDIARGAIGVLVRNVCGPSGIGVEPNPRNLAGELDAPLAARLADLWKDWILSPEVTRTLNWSSAQRLLCRRWIVDGEVFAQTLEGPIITLDHNTRVPLSLELIEADLCPLSYVDPGMNVLQGIARNAWGRPTAFYFYRQHPGDLVQLITRSSDLKMIPADRTLHIKLADRIGQVRGVSIFASVMQRLDDIKDYEESERIAAKIAASMAAYIRKGSPEAYGQTLGPDGTPQPREMRFQPGMIFDDLMPGEEIGLIDAKRPNPSLADFRDGQLRAAAGGLDVSYSSLSRNYAGTYSAQRQELVEQWSAYKVIQDDFIAAIVRPVYRKFVNLARIAGLIRPDGNSDPATIDDAVYVAPAMPWIDPLKEANSDLILERAGWASGPEIIRRRGGTPADVLQQESAWRKRARENSVALESDPATVAELKTMGEMAVS